MVGKARNRAIKGHYQYLSFGHFKNRPLTLSLHKKKESKATASLSGTKNKNTMIMTQTIFKTKITQESTDNSTCASCPKFKDSGEGRGRGECLLFNIMVFSHHPKVDDCKLNLASEATAKKQTTDYLGQQIRETRLLLERSKHRHSQTNQLSLKAPF